MMDIQLQGLEHSLERAVTEFLLCHLQFVLKRLVMTAATT